MSRLNKLLIQGFYSYEIRATYKEIYPWILEFTVNNKIRFVTYHAYRGDHYRISGSLIQTVRSIECHVSKS